MIFRKHSLTSFFTAAALSATMLLFDCAPPGQLTPIINDGEKTVQVEQEEALTDDEMLDLIQRQTLKYFWEFGHPVSGMARERTNNVELYGKDIVATGGTGFGIMAMIAGTERGWLTRQETLDRVTKIVNFLSTKATTYHGAFPHYMEGTTGETFAMVKNDDGGDLVETSFLMMGLLSARQYFNGSRPQETALRDKIMNLWENVDWQFYTNGQNQLYWHWSPNNGWGMNLPITGWNEALITHVLAAASPTHPVSADVYNKGWSRDGHIKDGQEYEGVKLPLGPSPYGGPLFFSQYSFLGIDPRGLKDRFADYWEQNRNHALINHAYAVENPKNFKGYGESWGLTASDGPDGYSDFSPANDHGVIAPTAAISSLPYTPEYSLPALRRFFEMGGKLWGPYGFRDSFDESRNWVAGTNLAIDQGPEVVMIENYRSGLLWRLFMNNPEVKHGLKRLGFESPYLPPPPTLAPAPSA